GIGQGIADRISGDSPTAGKPVPDLFRSCSAVECSGVRVFKLSGDAAASAARAGAGGAPTGVGWLAAASRASGAGCSAGGGGSRAANRRSQRWCVGEGPVPPLLTTCSVSRCRSGRLCGGGPGAGGSGARRDGTTRGRGG